jgi:hypothetical protein
MMRIDIEQLKDSLPPMIVGRLSATGFFRRAEVINIFLDTGECELDGISIKNQGAGEGEAEEQEEALSVTSEENKDGV